MPDPRNAPEASPSDLPEDAEGNPTLRLRGDVNAILALAKAYRAGTAPGGRDMKRCLDAYEAAADLESAEASFAVALFYLTGGVVAQDLKEGATRLRGAAERGSVPAKVYLGNLYELGIHYKADTEKADVWYRNAARGAGVESEPGDEEYIRDLAELGCARYVTKLVESGTLAEDDRTRLLQRARSHGLGLRSRDEHAVDRPTFTAALEHASPAVTVGAPTTTVALAPTLATLEAKVPDPKPVGPSQAALGIAAFGYAVLFVATGVGAAYAATLAARELVQHGTPLPGLGLRTHLVFPIVLGVVGVLPTWLVYRLGTVMKALLLGCLLGAVGWVGWGTGQLVMHRERPLQAVAFAVSAFLAGLLVLGLLGGTKKEPPRRRGRPPTR